MPPNWNDINRCGIWKVLGVTECNDCNGLIQCWGKETQLPEPSPEAQKHWEETLREIFKQPLA